MHLTDHISDMQLNEYLDNETTNRAEIEAHLDSCAECTARLSAIQALFAELASLPEETLSRNLAAHFTPDRKLPQLPGWLTLTATLQAAAALAALIVAIPFLPVILPRVVLPSFTTLFGQFQLQWRAFLNTFSTFHLPELASLPIPVMEMSTLLTVLAGIFVLWILGNGLLLRNRS
jgi:anti-sigma factor RsiW